MPRPPVALHVLVPAYGPSPYLADALRSAARLGTELTVVDDGSPDDAVTRAVRASGVDVELVRLPENRGVAGAFAACAELSRGEYTVVTGSDDLLGPRYADVVRTLVERFDRPEAVLPGVEVVDERGTPVLPPADRVKRLLRADRGRTALRRGQPLATSLLLGNWLYFPAVAWRTDVLRRYGFDRSLTTVMDLRLALEVVFAGGALATSPERAFSYRRHGASVSSTEAVGGARFAEERDVHRWAAQRAAALGWHRARAAALLRPTSRLHARVAR